jgi:DNA-binding NarL/FixJ family response regulator
MKELQCDGNVRQAMPLVSHGKAISVLVLDEHALNRAGVIKFLDETEDLVVVAEASTVREAIKLAGGYNPQVSVISLDKPQEIVAATRMLRKAAPRTEVLVLSDYVSSAMLQDLLAAQIRGCILKSASAEELVTTVRSCVGSSGRVFLAVPPAALEAGGDRAEVAIVLTEREGEVLKLVAQARSNAQIANALGISEPSVKRYLRNVFDKLGAVSRIDAVNKAIAASLIARPEFT